MNEQLVIHPRTKLAIDQYILAPSHSLMLVGSKGAGKLTTARFLIKKIIGSLDNNPYYLELSPDKNIISIESIRQLQSFVRLKTTGLAQWRRAILIQDAHFLTIEAQNAFLKLLEEPPNDTIIILTVVNQTNLLPTILSRAPVIDIKAASKAQAIEHFSKYNEATVIRAFLISCGQIGLMTKLLDKNQNQDMLRCIDLAKQFLQMPAFDRLVFIDHYLKQKDSIEDLLWALLLVSKAALKQAGQHAKQTLVKRWKTRITAVLNAQDALPSHPLPKLLLTDLSLQI